MEWGRAEGWGLHPALHGFVYPIPAQPCMTEKLFLPFTSPLGPTKPRPTL